MNKLNSKRIKKILLGVLLSDGNLNKTPNSARFDFYNKQETYVDYMFEVFQQLTGSNPVKNERFDKRFNSKGYRVFTKTSRYFSKLYQIFYLNTEKKITTYVLNRLDEESLAHIWMCDGMLHFKWDKSKDKVQIHGYFCLESFSKEELLEFIKFLNLKYNIHASLLQVKWGKKYRIMLTGENLRKFISLIYDYVLPCFKYKCNLYYKNDDVMINLSKAEHFITIYKKLDEIEDIIRTRRNS